MADMGHQLQLVGVTLLEDAMTEDSVRVREEQRERERERGQEGGERWREDERMEISAPRTGASSTRHPQPHFRPARLLSDCPRKMCMQNKHLRDLVQNA